MEIEFIPDKNLSKQQLRIIKELNNMVETIDDINVIMSEDVKHISHSKKITNNEAQQLSDKLGFDTVIEEPMDLTHIYNQDDPEFEPLKNAQKLDFNS